MPVEVPFPYITPSKREYSQGSTRPSSLRPLTEALPLFGMATAGAIQVVPVVSGRQGRMGH